MPYSRFIFGLTLFVMAATSNPALADNNRAKAIIISISGGNVALDNARTSQAKSLRTLSIRYNFTQHWGLEAWFAQAGANNDLNEDVFRTLSGQFFPKPEWRLQPYFGLGVGVSDFSDNNPQLTNSSLLLLSHGWQLQLNHRFGLFAGIRQTYSDDDTADTFTHVGLQLWLGRAPQTSPTVTYDSDNDGIADTQDACPNSATNITVDERGCVLTPPVLF